MTYDEARAYRALSSEVRARAAKAHWNGEDSLEVTEAEFTAIMFADEVECTKPKGKAEFHYCNLLLKFKRT